MLPSCDIGRLIEIMAALRRAEERGLFDFGAVVEAIAQKMVRRHPHVFAAAVAVKTQSAAITSAEKSANAAASSGTCETGGERAGAWPGSLLDDVPFALPGLTRAVKLQAKASCAGFDWNNASLVLEKIREEIGEIEAAADARDRRAVEDEIGDLLFTVANLARHSHADPEAAIRRANAKFERRFRFIENALAANGKAPGDAALEEMEALWNVAKKSEKKGTP
jgi:nucleoside triphosphate diphosphatase